MYLTIDQTATQLGVHRQTVERAIHRGELSAVRVGFVFRIAEDELRAYLDRRRSRPTGNNSATQGYLTIDDVARRLGVSRMTVNRAIWRGDLAAIKIGSAVRIGEQDLAEYLIRPLQATG